MEIIEVNRDNIDTEHICCAISEMKGDRSTSLKKEWLKKRFDDGLIFQKLNVRGKVFVEYLPAEKAWCPIHANEYFFINCFWVSGQFKGQGWADRLLKQCFDDAKKMGARGIVILSSAKKMPFLSDPKYLKYKGFQVADRAEPYFELLYQNFDENDSSKPAFRDCAKHGKTDRLGLVLYFTNQCPHAEKYACLIKECAAERGWAINMIKIESTEEAQNAPTPFTTYSLFYNGSFMTNEILSEKKFYQLLDQLKQNR
ncbi:GNAT family N-acetyltransferase [Anoxybacterium hadale]|uniref:GNAT family N-acetyltransferase n=1 Tax=Anoxybacterium hadale TaxID=3408580 RepID=A0ACD1A9Q7_9FIRM|nr:GNAT family N-acetyltransferase [Clostridiales bacterium]